jgi:ABC-type antimicrobial peptide transport system permease subunit
LSSDRINNSADPRFNSRSSARVSISVAQKTRDIGVHLALGADASQVLRLVAREGMVMTAAGVLAGIGLAIASSRSLTSLLFEVAPTDPATLGTVVILVVAVAAAATWRPARRAIRIDPLVALRQ